MERINRNPPGQNPISDHHGAVQKLTDYANQTPQPTAQPIQPDPNQMPDPDLDQQAAAQCRNMPLDKVPPLSFFGIPPDLQLQFNLETLQHVLQILFPSDPFTRGVMYVTIVNTVARYVTDKERCQ